MRSKALSDADCIVRFCLGSEEYKRREAQRFTGAVARIDREVLLHLLYRANLLPLFGFEIDRLGIEPSLLTAVHPYRIYQGIVNRELLLLLEALAAHLRLDGCRPVLLKGPSFWGDHYAEHALRPVKDLDLLALEDGSAEALCKALGALGFAAESDLEEPNHYELPELRRTLEIEVAGPAAEALMHVVRRYAPPRLRQLTGNRFSLLIPVEIHTALFLYTDGSRPELEARHLRNWGVQPEYLILSAAANLPYLSVKLDLDARRHVGRSIKLLADLVRIIVSATPEEIALSREIAEEWYATDSYALALNTLAILTPEISYLHLPEADYEPLSALVSDILNQDTVDDPL